MPELIFYGASDDLIEVEGAIEEEYPADSGDRANLLVFGPDERSAIVSVGYTEDGVWAVTYGQAYEDTPVYEGRVTARGYTAVLTIEVPEGTMIRRLH